MQILSGKNTMYKNTVHGYQAEKTNTIALMERLHLQGDSISQYETWAYR